MELYLILLAMPCQTSLNSTTLCATTLGTALPGMEILYLVYPRITN